MNQLAAYLPAESTQSNSELVREAYRLRFDCTRVQDTACSIGRFLGLLAPEVELLGAAKIWTACRGRRAATEALIDAALRWAECSFALEDLRTPDEGRVLACGTVLARPAGRSEIHQDPFVDLWTFEEGRAIRIESLS
jgi:hypothetical protein